MSSPPSAGPIISEIAAAIAARAGSPPTKREKVSRMIDSEGAASTDLPPGVTRGDHDNNATMKASDPKGGIGGYLVALPPRILKSSLGKSEGQMRPHSDSLGQEKATIESSNSSVTADKKRRSRKAALPAFLLQASSTRSGGQRGSSSSSSSSGTTAIELVDEQSKGDYEPASSPRVAKKRKISLGASGTADILHKKRRSSLQDSEEYQPEDSDSEVSSLGTTNPTPKRKKGSRPSLGLAKTSRFDREFHPIFERVPKDNKYQNHAKCRVCDRILGMKNGSYTALEKHTCWQDYLRKKEGATRTGQRGENDRRDGHPTTIEQAFRSPLQKMAADEWQRQINRLIMRMVAFVVTDNATTMHTVGELLKDRESQYALDGMAGWLGCCAHTLHLVVTNALAIFKEETNRGCRPRQELGDDEIENPSSLFNQAENTRKHTFEASTSSDAEGSDDASESEDDYETIFHRMSEAAENEDKEWYPGVDAEWEQGMELKGTLDGVQRATRIILVKVRALNKLLKLSAPARDLLDAVKDEVEEECKGFQPLLDVSTRWNSTYDMLAEVLRCRPLIVKLQEKVHDLPKSSPVQKAMRRAYLNPSEWDRMADIVRALQPMKMATLWMSSTCWPSLPIVYGVMQTVRLFLAKEPESRERRRSTFCKKVIAKLLLKLDFYFGPLMRNRWVLATSYLCPETRLPSCPVAVPDDIGREACKGCIDALGITDDDRPDQKCAPKNPSAEAPAVVVEQVDGGDEFNSFLQDIYEGAVSREVPRDVDYYFREYEKRARSMVNHRKAGPDPELFSRFWSDNDDLGPLSSLARLAESVPSSSVSSESAFSRAGSLDRHQRSRLRDSTLRTLVLLKDLIE
ncbi:hypothetical protein FOZ63_030407 [Perkinsus olseni]|uniref:HAT C-terminal dimerisation domain-containing protein n=1 Tax=Perkinsus olseni TaxID=32597 RepID=A0A7J6UCF0_PEROL|nr:hypothetical protein FOZ63_030407 [Perkinsus olseni]KAF4754876.1 hypothetical protein FOZ62_017016 [Perkinsus olseni]